MKEEFGIIFDCDGVLADTEKFGHLPAFNLAFNQLELPVQWSVEEYAVLLEIGGGKERLQSLFKENGSLVKTKWDSTEESREELIAEIHKKKTKNYVEIVKQGAVPARPGIRRLVTEASKNGWRFAVASTSAEVSVRAILDHVLGSELAKSFSVFAGDVVAKKKPAPDIYQLAILNGGFEVERTVAIEDSGIGSQAAIAAGLPCLVTVSTFTKQDNFEGTDLVVSSLGEFDKEISEVLQNPLNINLIDYVSVDTIKQLIHSKLKVLK
jgi:HAD superfamily hydrolase (TIGR01509 family)